MRPEIAANPRRLSPTMPRIALPPLARLGSRLGGRSNPLLSRTQSQWMAAASSAMDAMARQGAPMENLAFGPLSDRAIPSLIDQALAKGSFQSIFSHPHSISHVRLPRAQPPQAIVVVRHGKTQRRFWFDACQLMGSPSHAMAFIVGQECARAIFCLGQWSALPSSLRHLGISHPCPQARAALENAFCDAVGCWASALEGCNHAIGRALDLRTNASPEPQTLSDRLRQPLARSLGGLFFNAPPKPNASELRSNWLLQPLASQLGGLALEQMNFQQLLDAIDRTCEALGPGALERALARPGCA